MANLRSAAPWLGAAALALVAASAPGLAAASGPTAAAGYTLAPWASGVTTGCAASAGNGSPTCYYNPDSITHDAAHVFVGYQNAAAADGSSGSSEVVQYANVGSAPAVQAQYHVPGKNDGLRVDPATGYVWALSNEDANPILTILHPGTPGGTPSTYPLPTESRFSGGYDDIAFLPQGTFLSASNPAGNRQGMNNYRSVVSVHFNGAGDPVLTPVLTGTVTGTDRSTGRPVTVNLTDPDSLSVSSAGELVLNDQGDSTLVFVANPGTAQQAVSVLFLQPSAAAPVVDETTWARAGGHFLVANHGNPGAVYRLDRTGGFAAGSAYTTVSNDNPAAATARTVSLLDTTTGATTPVVTGLSSPKGLEFIG